LSYFLKRLIQLFPVLILISVVVFFLIHLTPGDPVAVMLGGEEGGYNRAAYDVLRKQLGLDQPVHVQYITWLGRVISGDFGNSLRTSHPVLPIIIERYPATMYLALSSLVLGLLVAIPAGTVAAIRQNSIWDYSAMMFALFGICVPNFWLALLLILGFAIYLGWFPTMGYVSPGTSPLLFIWHLTLPTVVLATDMASSITRYLRAEMLEQLRQDYVRTARAKGLSPFLVFYKHTLKNSLIASSTAIGLHVGRLLGGAAVVETVFAWPGIGSLVLEAVYNRDYPLLQGAVLVLATNYVVINLLVDMLHQWLDPRVRLSKAA
jgi:peptide/nickel transport system permease protein